MRFYKDTRDEIDVARNSEIDEDLRLTLAEMESEHAPAPEPFALSAAELAVFEQSRGLTGPPFAPSKDCTECFGSGQMVGYNDLDELAYETCSCVKTGVPFIPDTVEAPAAADPAGVPYDISPADDPKCVCGVHYSEHSGLGCGNFQSPASWAAESKAIAGMSEFEFEQRYGR
jgi:hypothetical protein